MAKYMTTRKKNQKGATMVEYSLLITLVALTALTAIRELGLKSNQLLLTVNYELGGGTEKGGFNPIGTSGPQGGGPKRGDK